MNIDMIHGHAVYIVTEQDVPGVKPSYFQSVCQNWKEGEKKTELSQEEIRRLKETYHSGHMTEKETVDFLGELVEAGILSTDTARNIFCGVIPLDVSREDLENHHGTLQKCDPNSEPPRNYQMEFMRGNLSSIGTVQGFKGFGYYQSMYEYAKSNTNVDVENSAYFKDYANYLNILARISGVASYS